MQAQSPPHHPLACLLPFPERLADTRDLGFVVREKRWTEVEAEAEAEAGPVVFESAGGEASASGAFILEANTEAGNNRRTVPPRAMNTSLMDTPTFLMTD